MRIAVMGAGLLGVSTAYYLAKEGHQVVVVDRQPGPAMETSFATACLLTPGHTTAWARPKAPWQLMQSFWHKDASLIFRPRPSLQLAKWSLRFLRECTSARYRANTLAKHYLAKYSLGEISRISREHGLSWDNLARGILLLEPDSAHLQMTKQDMAPLIDAGVEVEILDRDQLVALEPALGKSRLKVAGALRLPADQSGDGHKFAAGLAATCNAMGVEFRHGVTVQALEATAGRIDGVRTATGKIVADTYVMALGSYSSLLAATVRLDLPVYPVKGYSVTMPVLDPGKAPSMGGVEEGSHVAFSRLGERVRMTTTAEFTGYETGHRPKNFAKILRIAGELFDGGVDTGKATYWACLRPATPDGPPAIGATPFSNLWLNTGHGYLGWTMSCGSSRLLCDLIAGRKPEIDPSPYRFDRF